MPYFDRIIRFSFCCFAFLFLSVFCRKQTDTFSILAISSNRPFHPEYETALLTTQEENELKIALSQPYQYFGRGGQAFTFFSADGRYAIKFFKQRLFRPSWLLNHIPLPSFLHRYREKRNWKRLDKWERDFFSYKVAFDELKDETGLIYVHLNPTTHLKTQLPIIDRIGVAHLLELDHFDFIVQRRADKVFDRIDHLMEEKKSEEAQKAIWEIFALIATRAQKGFRDRDPNIETNCGFIEDKAVKIDVGRFVRCEAMQKKELRCADIERITAPFGKWIEQKYPELFPAYLRIKESFIQ